MQPGSYSSYYNASTPTTSESGVENSFAQIPHSEAGMSSHSSGVDGNSVEGNMSRSDVQ